VTSGNCWQDKHVGIEAMAATLVRPSPTISDTNGGWHAVQLGMPFRHIIIIIMLPIQAIAATLQRFSHMCTHTDTIGNGERSLQHDETPY
jgi:hypothetical protein